MLDCLQVVCADLLTRADNIIYVTLTFAATDAEKSVKQQLRQRPCYCNVPIASIWRPL